MRLTKLHDRGHSLAVKGLRRHRQQDRRPTLMKTSRAWLQDFEHSESVLVVGNKCHGTPSKHMQRLLATWQHLQHERMFSHSGVKPALMEASQVHNATVACCRFRYGAQHALRQQRLHWPILPGLLARADGAHASRKRLPHEHLLLPLHGNLQGPCNIGWLSQQHPRAQRLRAARMQVLLKQNWSLRLHHCGNIGQKAAARGKVRG